MKSVKILGLMALAALVLTVAAGAGIASADTFCKANEGICGSGNLLTHLEGSTPSGENSVLLAGSFAVGCNSSMGTGTLTSSGGNKGLTGLATGLQFTSCIGSCTGATAVNLPYSAVGKSSTQTVTLSGVSGSPAVTFTNCLGLGVSCTYGAFTWEFHVHGGSPGDVAAKEILLKRSSGLCPAEGHWTAKYVVSNSPSAFLLSAP
jgi:hypothetical protein